MASFDSPYTTTPQEYAGWGAGLFTEPALKVTFADGNRDLVLHFVRATQDSPQAVELQLKDISREIYVTLRYSIDAESGILARSADIENRDKQPVVIEQAAAAQWTLPPARYNLSYLTGRWAGEWTLNQEPILGGERVIESRRGTTGHQANPWFAISRDDSQTAHRRTFLSGRRARRSLVRRAGVVGFLAHHCRTHATGCGARHRRFQSL